MTIYALSTGPGVSGIAVIRVSGAETSLVIKTLTGKALPKARLATLRKINKNLGMKDLIAKDESEYISKAKELAEDQDKLLKIRKKIFAIAPYTPLFDKTKFVNDFFSCLENI